MSGSGPQRRSSTWVVRIALSYLALPLTSLLTGPLLARLLGPAERGELAAILTPIALLPVLLSLGLQEATNHFVSRGALTARRAIRVGSGPALACGVASSVLIWSASSLLFPDDPGARLLLALGGLTLVPELWFVVVRGATLGVGRFDLANQERWIGAVSRLAVLILIAAAGGISLTTAAWTTLGSSLFGAAVLLLVLRQRQLPPISSVGARAVLSYGSRSWVASLAGLLNARLDQAILLPFVGAAPLGQYAVAATLVAITLNLGAALRDVLLTRAVGNAGMEITLRATRLLVIGIGAVTVVGAATSFITIPLLFGSEFGAAVPLAAVLFIGALPASINAALGAGLMASGRPGSVSVGELFGLVITALGLLTLVGPLEVMGAAVTSVASYAATTLVLLIVLKRVAGVGPRDCLVITSDDLRWARQELAPFAARIGRTARANG